MGLKDDALARVAQRHAEERAFVRTITRCYEAAEMSADRARRTIAAAEAERARVLAEWATATGWSVARVAEHTGLAERDIGAAVRGAGRTTADGALGARPRRQGDGAAGEDGAGRTAGGER